MPGSFDTGSIDLKSDASPHGASRRQLSHPGVIVFGIVAVCFGVYAVRKPHLISSVTHDAIHFIQNAGLAALYPAFYGIAGLVTFLILLTILRVLGSLLGNLKKATPLLRRPEKSLDQFIEESGAVWIGLRVAREGYHLLRPHYPDQMCIDLGDGLRTALRLSDEEIGGLHASLLTRCDRREDPPASTEVSSLVSVFDLLHCVENAHRIRGNRSTDPPAWEPRNPTSSQRKALHAAALRSIDSRNFPPIESARFHRRSSDYEGPRRRATDNSLELDYNGPYRRASDSSTRTSAEHSAPTKGDLDDRSGSIFRRTKRVTEPSSHT